jgi:hypothetical protein
MTEADYDALLVAQGGCCAICRERQAFVVDHDHATGAVRGLLCNRCNTGLGHLGDSPILLLRAIEYLLRTLKPRSVRRFQCAQRGAVSVKFRRKPLAAPAFSRTLAPSSPLAPPTRVYVGTQTELDVYGLLE